MMIRLVYRALTGMNGETGFAMVAIAASIKRRTKAKSKPQCHPAGSGSSIRSRPLPSGTSASIRTMASTSPRRARRMAMEEVTVMLIPIGTI
jgi:hypothetical protein